MPVSTIDLQRIAALAHLNLDDEMCEQMVHDVTSLINFVEELGTLDVSGVAPMAHPLAGTDYLRADEITEPNRLDDLKLNAELEQDLYIVPQVVTSGKEYA